jgi:hypothetical protein
VAVSAKGKILEIEKTVEPSRLPEAVASAIKAKYPNAKIKKAEEITKYKDDEDDKAEAKKDKDDDDKSEKAFEVVLTPEGKSDVEVKLSPQGKILEEEDKGKAKDDDDDDKPGKKDDSKEKAKAADPRS